MNFMRNIDKSNKVDKVITTKQYDRSYNKLKKDHRNDVIKDINETVDNLIYFNVSTQKSNHPLKGLDVNELHIRSDVLLLYRYSNNILTISLNLIDLTNHTELKNKKYQKEIKKTIKDLKESKGDKTMEYMEYSTTNENTLSVRYKWKNTVTGKETIFDYEVPYEMFMDEVRNYFDRKYDVKVDGKDNDIWNMLVDLGEQYNIDILQDLMDDTDVQANLTKALEKDAKEMFDELCHEEADDENDLNESLTESEEAKQDSEKEFEDDGDVEAEGFEDEEHEWEDDYEYPEMQVYYRVYFTDKDGDELYAVDDGDYDFEANYDTREEALDAMKKILQDPKVKADPEIGGCHSAFIADEDEWDEDPEGNYDTYGYEPTDLVDEVKKD